MRGRKSARRARASSSRRTLPPRAFLFGALGALAVVAIGLVVVAGGRGGEAAVGTLNTADFHALAFHPEDPNVAYFGHHNGLMRTHDGGRTWTPLVDRRGFDAMGLAVSGADANRIYLAGHDIFQVSTDDGQSWQPVQHDLPGTDVHGFAMSPDDPNQLYAYVVGLGVFLSENGGSTWERLASLPGDVHALASAGGSPETLHAGGVQSGVLKSSDGGKTWLTANGVVASGGVMAMAVDPSDRQVVYAGTRNGLYKSRDGGDNWDRLSFPGPNVVTLAVSPARPGTLLAVAVQGNEGRVYRSEDAGVTWGS